MKNKKEENKKNEPRKDNNKKLEINKLHDKKNQNDNIENKKIEVKKIEKKYENKFKKTAKGKRLYNLNLASYVLYIVSVIFMIIVILNEGKTLTGWLVTLMILAFICVLLATLMCTGYYYSLRQYISEQKNID